MNINFPFTEPPNNFHIGIWNFTSKNLHFMLTTCEVSYANEKSALGILWKKSWCSLWELMFSEDKMNIDIVRLASIISHNKSYKKLC